ncbi:MAG: LamG domain-containing protein, partial [Anaerolineales bacterium]|nr:LamG domain-containing protein [Anaerolineales bacterium]
KFDGSGDSLYLADHADWDLGSVCTIEFWIYNPHLPNGNTWIGNTSGGNQGSSGWGFFFQTDGKIGFSAASNAGTQNHLYTPAGSIKDNTWHHVAFVHDSSNNYVYIDGVDQTMSDTHGSSSWADFSVQLTIGENNGASYFNGNLDEYRISNVARYPSGTTFTPTTTQFVSDANTLLLIHGGEAYTGALTGETTQSCVTFDGTGDAISVPDHADWDLVADTTNYTIDCWIKFVDHASTEGIVNQENSGGSNEYWEIKHDNGSGFSFRLYDGASVAIDTGGGGEITDTDWHHLALIKVSTEYGIYVDGTQVNYTNDASTDTISDSLHWGGAPNFNGNYFEGSLAEMRIYQGNPFSASPNATPNDTITVPTARHTSDANTKLLIHGDEGVGTAAFTDSGNTGHTVTPTGNAFSGNGGTFTDSGNTGHTVTENGNAQRETESEYKFADDGVGYYFDGTTDYLSAADHADWDFPNGGDFTIELFVRSPDINASATDYEFYAQYVDASNWTAFRQQSGTGNLLWLVKESASNVVVVKSGNNLISNNEWHHIAICRENDDYYTYIDGVDQTAS